MPYPPSNPPSNPPAGYDSPTGAYPPPPPPAPYPPPGYASPTGAYPQPYYGVPPKTSGKAVAILVLGIVGLVLLCGYGIGVILAIVALALSPGAKRELAASGGVLTGEGMIKAGVICSWITVGITLAGLVFFVGIFALAALSSAAG